MRSWTVSKSQSRIYMFGYNEMEKQKNRFVECPFKCGVISLAALRKSQKWMVFWNYTLSLIHFSNLSRAEAIALDEYMAEALHAKAMLIAKKGDKREAMRYSAISSNISYSSHAVAPAFIVLPTNRLLGRVSQCDSARMEPFNAERDTLLEMIQLEVVWLAVSNKRAIVSVILPMYYSRARTAGYR